MIFSSDNGGVGGYDREGLKAEALQTTRLSGRKGKLYEGGIRVPYIFRWPGHIQGGRTCHEPINSVDLYPTLLESLAQSASELSARWRQLCGTSENGRRREAQPRVTVLAFSGYLVRATLVGERRLRERSARATGSCRSFLKTAN